MGGQTKTAPSGTPIKTKVEKFPVSAAPQERGVRTEEYGNLTREQVELLKRTYCKGSSDDEFRMFLNVCKRTGLDPFAHQMHAVKRWSTEDQQFIMAIQIGIDGYRLMAARTGEYAGSDEPVFTPEDAEFPSRATVTVWRLVKGTRVPFTATARWREYVQTKKDGTPNRMWRTMPYGQLGKCAEALALRKAFPAELSGLYTHEEMEQADNTAGTPPPTEADLTPRPVGEEPTVVPVQDPPAPDDVQQVPPEAQETAGSGPASASDSGNGGKPAPAVQDASKAVQAIPPTKAFDGPKTPPPGDLRIPADWPEWKLAPISEAQGKRFFALGHAAKLQPDQVKIIISEFGYPRPQDVLRGHYDAICERILPGSSQQGRKSGGGGR